MIEICKIEDLHDAGKAVVFDIDRENFTTGFAFRYHGEIFAYRNQCPHAGSELDWVRGQFFDDDAKFLVCATHGARFEPDSGACVAGPCIKQSLMPIQVSLQGNTVYANF